MVTIYEPSETQWEYWIKRNKLVDWKLLSNGDVRSLAPYIISDQKLWLAGSRSDQDVSSMPLRYPQHPPQTDRFGSDRRKRPQLLFMDDRARTCQAVPGSGGVLHREKSGASTMATALESTLLHYVEHWAAVVTA